ncbi:Sir2 family NAD-dependent protein deacetylase [Leucobacter sp. 1207-22]|uniref:Sir2 family NAD-dependent protein deacetylase n=1 Tax=Leucobacter sp. 1207-22 TaxID=2604456 RepID=UPI0040637AA1
MPAPLHATDDLIALAQQQAARGPLVALTGAGISTDSGIPDYRGAGPPPRTPMSISQFMDDEMYRRRFWAGARVNAARMDRLEPNAGHLALAQLEAAGHATGVITQNVDNLHRQAGSRQVAELHGNGGVIRCLDCGERWTRTEILARFDRANPGYAARHRLAETEIAPDGDALVEDFAEVVVPVCPICQGTLRPDVVYFGETVPTPVFDHALELLTGASLLLVAGTSLAVNTGMRLVHRAERLGIPLAVVNRGKTAIDDRASVRVRIDSGTSEVLSALAAAL